MRDFRLMFAGMVSGGFFARLMEAPYTAPVYLGVCGIAFVSIELVAYVSKHVRWER